MSKLVLLSFVFMLMVGCVGVTKVPDGKGGLDVYTTTYSHQENE